MTNLRIYRLAMDQLLRQWAAEKDKLQLDPSNQLAKSRIVELDNEMDELDEMILLEKVGIC